MANFVKDMAEVMANDNTMQRWADKIDENLIEGNDASYLAGSTLLLVSMVVGLAWIGKRAVKGGVGVYRKLKR